MLPAAYQTFLKELLEFIPRRNVFTDPLRTLAYGTDASFYRLIPKIVVGAPWPTAPTPASTGSSRKSWWTPTTRTRWWASSSWPTGTACP